MDHVRFVGRGIPSRPILVSTTSSNTDNVCVQCTRPEKVLLRLQCQHAYCYHCVFALTRKVYHTESLFLYCTACCQWISFLPASMGGSARVRFKI